MTLTPKQQQKNCFIACSEEKINPGLCDCINRMKNRRLYQDNIIKEDNCIHDYKLDVLKGDILCTKCGLSKYLE